MRSGEGDVLEEWFTIGHCVIDLRYGVVGDGVREMEIGGFDVDQTCLGEPSALGFQNESAASKQSEVFVETALRWQRMRLVARRPLVSQFRRSYPPPTCHLPDIKSAISRLTFDDFGDGDAVIVQIALVAWYA